jgi:hypothetical protein
MIFPTVAFIVSRERLESLNAGKPYAEQIKPFNFLQTSQISPFGHPEGVDPEKCHLISPYDPDPRKWLEKEWVDQYTGNGFASRRAVTTDQEISRELKLTEILSLSMNFIRNQNALTLLKIRATGKRLVCCRGDT